MHVPVFICIHHTVVACHVGQAWTLSSSAAMALPLAMMYGVQNWMLFYAAGNMDPLTFNLVNQSKLIWTAFFLFVVMHTVHCMTLHLTKPAWTQNPI